MGERVLPRLKRNRVFGTIWARAVPMGLKLDRHKPVGCCIADFICHKCCLLVKADGGEHAESTECGHELDTWLRHRGYQVLRVWTREVMQPLNGVLEQTRLDVFSRSPPTPLPLAGERSEAPDKNVLD